MEFTEKNEFESKPRFFPLEKVEIRTKTFGPIEK